jgi:hypothetical protein
MPRLRAVLAPRHVQLRNLQLAIEQCHSDALETAKRAGDLLLEAALEERPALWAAAGVKRSAAYNYMQIAKGWRVVQRSGSIDAALKVLRRPRPRRGPFLWPDWPEIYEWFELERQSLYSPAGVGE